MSNKNCPKCTNRVMPDVEAKLRVDLLFKSAELAAKRKQCNEALTELDTVSKAYTEQNKLIDTLYRRINYLEGQLEVHRELMLLRTAPIHPMSK